MSQITPLIAGTIRIAADSKRLAPWEADDSTLELVLASFARRSTMAGTQTDVRQPLRLLATRRLGWPTSTGADLVVRTNLAQLLDDLQAEMERFEG